MNLAYSLTMFVDDEARAACEKFTIGVRRPRVLGKNLKIYMV